MSIKKFVLTMVIALVSMVSNAQNAKSVNVSFGVMYPQTVDVTLSYEVGTKHHNAWEFFANAASKWKDCASCGHICANSFWKDNCTWGLGATYKPCVVRTRNSYGSVRLGGSLGSDTHEVLGGIHAGYEQNYALKGGWRVFWQIKCDCMINGEDLFRTGVTIGIKIPTSSTR